MMDSEIKLHKLLKMKRILFCQLGIEEHWALEPPGIRDVAIHKEFVDYFYNFWILKSHHFYDFWIQKCHPPFSRFLDPEATVFLQFLDREISPFLRVLEFIINFPSMLQSLRKALLSLVTCLEVELHIYVVLD